MKLNETRNEWLIPVACTWGVVSSWCKAHGRAVSVALYASLWLSWVILGPSVRQRMDNEYWGISQLSSLTIMYLVLLLLAGHLTWTAVFKVLTWWEKRKK